MKHMKTHLQAGLYNPTIPDNANLMKARLDVLNSLLCQGTGGDDMLKVIDHVNAAIEAGKGGQAKCADGKCTAVHFVLKNCVWLRLELFGGN